MAFCNDDLVYGIKRPDPNRRTDPCGCEFVRLAATPGKPEGWYYLKKCGTHEMEAWFEAVGVA